MRLAAVVLNFRTPEKTVRAVRSLEASTRPGVEILVVDNGSGDGSVTALREQLPSITLIALPRNLGFAGGCNAGIREALTRGMDLVLLLNSDAELSPDALAILERELEARPDAGIAAPAVLTRTRDARIESMGMTISPRSGRVRLRRFGTAYESGHHRLTERVQAVTGCAMLIRRDVLERVGLLSEDYFFGFEDVDFCLRAAKAGRSTVVAGAAVVHHEGHASAGGLSPFLIEHSTCGHLLMLERQFPLPPLLVPVRALSVAALSLLHAIVAADGSRLAGAAAVLRGVRRYLARRRS